MHNPSVPKLVYFGRSKGIDKISAGLDNQNRSRAAQGTEAHNASTADPWSHDHICRTDGKCNPRGETLTRGSDKAQQPLQVNSSTEQHSASTQPFRPQLQETRVGHIGTDAKSRDSG